MGSFLKAILGGDGDAPTGESETAQSQLVDDLRAELADARAIIAGQKDELE